MTGDDKCRKQVEETEISDIQQKERISYTAAKQRYFMTRPSGRKTFAEAVKRKVSKKEEVTSEVRQRLKQILTEEHAAIGKGSKRRISEETEEDEVRTKRLASDMREEEREKSVETTEKIAAEITRMETEEGERSQDQNDTAGKEESRTV